VKATGERFRSFEADQEFLEKKLVEQFKVTLYDETLILSKIFFYIFILSNDISLNSSNFFEKMLKSDRDIGENAMTTE
jgi:hypothetical protein